jgi:hypothetical protein
MNYHDQYIQIIEKLKKDERPLIKLSPEFITELKTEWEKILELEDIPASNLVKILCILDNTQNFSFAFNECFLQTFQKISDPELLIYTLAASQKHIINESLRTGVMIPPFYFEQLKKLLNHKNPEVVEWTLRNIESMGPLSLRLKEDVRKINLSFFKLFNTHQKACTQIIELLEKQWKNLL